MLYLVDLLDKDRKKLVKQPNLWLDFLMNFHENNPNICPRWDCSKQYPATFASIYYFDLAYHQIKE